MNRVHRGELGGFSGLLTPLAIPASSDADVLWAWLESLLRAEADVEGLFYLAYPVGDAGGSPEELVERAIWKTNYPQHYLDALYGNPLTDDRSAKHVLETGETSRWHDPAEHARMTPGEKRRARIDAEHGMSVGACYPIFNVAGRICGGFGLRSASQDPKRFDAILDAYGDQIAHLLIAFEARFRGPFARTVFKLSPQEQKVLAHVAGGMAADRTAHALKLKPKTVEAYLRSVRTKTLSMNTAEAVAKAIFFNLV
jgi:DNA-binding CsgD family transcriptional regulator